jgi:transcription antitermination protein NusB
MGKRRQAREMVMQYLYQAAVTKTLSEQAPDSFWKEKGLPQDTQGFAKKIVAHALKNREQIDGLIEKYALNWKLDRIAAVDLAVFRMALAEMLFISSTPPIVVIDEAVEIAKHYSTMESGAFINGILDRIRKEVVDGKPSRK